MPLDLFKIVSKQLQSLEDAKINLKSLGGHEKAYNN